MTDRKLPVVQTIYLRIAPETRFGYEYLRVWDMSLAPKDGLEAFEPAAPKCLTCARYFPPEPHGRHGACKTGPYSEKTVPPDGSGYCHEHSELRNG